MNAKLEVCITPEKEYLLHHQDSQKMDGVKLIHNHNLFIFSRHAYNKKYSQNQSTIKNRLIKMSQLQLYSYETLINNNGFVLLTEHIRK